MPYNNVGLNAEYLKDVEASGRAKDNPAVTSAKADLAPVRAEALESLKEFQILCESLRPQYDEARDLAVHASSLGIRSAELHTHVNVAFTIMDGGVVNFQAFVTGIDNLNPWQVVQGWHLRKPAQLIRHRDSFDALRRHASALPELVAEQQERIARGGGVPPKPLVGLIADSRS